jgi:uncharacterized protein YjbI with pentapeptide repeats
VVGRTGAANLEMRFATQGNRIKSSYLAHRFREFNLTEAGLSFIRTWSALKHANLRHSALTGSDTNQHRLDPAQLTRIKKS